MGGVGDQGGDDIGGQTIFLSVITAEKAMLDCFADFIFGREIIRSRIILHHLTDIVQQAFNQCSVFIKIGAAVFFQNGQNCYGGLGHCAGVMDQLGTGAQGVELDICLLYTSPSPRD